MVRFSHLSRSMPSGCAKRRTTSKTREKPAALPEAASSVSSACSSAVAWPAGESASCVAVSPVASPAVACSVQRKSAVSRASSSSAPASPLRAFASAAPSTLSSAVRPTTSQTFSRYSAKPTARPSAVSTARWRLKISRAGPMQANTRSAPRMPSLLEALHPVGDAAGQLAQHVGPVTDRCARRVAAGRRGGRWWRGRRSRGRAAASPSRSRWATTR